MLALVPPEVVTDTSTVPAAWAGETAVIWVPLFTVKLVAAPPPKATSVAPFRLVPVMITLLPPAVLPLAGVREVTVGAGVGTAAVVKLTSLPYTLPSPSALARK